MRNGRVSLWAIKWKKGSAVAYRVIFQKKNTSTISIVLVPEVAVYSARTVFPTETKA